MTLNELAQHDLILDRTFAILRMFTNKQPMWDEIQDMQGEIFDVPNIETILVEDENGNVGVDLTEDA